jgi:hypothetical protein
MAINYRPRQEIIWENLERYKRIYRSPGIYLIVKDEFFDIANLEQKSFTNGKSISIFNENEVNQLKELTLKTFQSYDMVPFITKYFSRTYRFEFSIESMENHKILTWFIRGGTFGTTFFEKPGGLILTDAKDYFILTLFSKEKFGIVPYDEELQALN